MGNPGKPKNSNNGNGNSLFQDGRLNALIEVINSSQTSSTMVSSSLSSRPSAAITSEDVQSETGADNQQSSGRLRQTIGTQSDTNILLLNRHNDTTLGRPQQQVSISEAVSGNVNVTHLAAALFLRRFRDARVSQQFGLTEPLTNGLQQRQQSPIGGFRQRVFNVHDNTADNENLNGSGSGGVDSTSQDWSFSNDETDSAQIAEIQNNWVQHEPLLQQSTSGDNSQNRLNNRHFVVMTIDSFESSNPSRQEDTILQQQRVNSRQQTASTSTSNSRTGQSISSHSVTSQNQNSRSSPGAPQFGDYAFR
ncbi:hypothetical protein MP228_011532 [Amoeboaphelidium protococcarum]|nr:hypothetical protein MP228_011532 [Amoeboaphelidium protococcarum]